MDKDCVERCEFQEFCEGVFYCKLYDEELFYIPDSDFKLTVCRCEKCKTAGEIGTNTLQERIRKLKAHIGWMMDFFYSFKDDMEEEVTSIYRILKEIEEDKEEV